MSRMEKAMIVAIGMLIAVGVWAIESRVKMPTEAEFKVLREDMVKYQIQDRGVRDQQVLAAMRKVLRHEFIPEEERPFAYEDHPLPIGLDQTISQPYIVAFMTEALLLKPKEKVLEIGTGSGYQAAVLAEMGAEVYSIEIMKPLGERAARDLARLGYGRVHLRIGDGYEGWPDAGLFDAIVITAAPPQVPKPLLDQLKDGGRLVAPVGTYYQTLIRMTRDQAKLRTEELLPVSFVPMTGKALH